MKIDNRVDPLLTKLLQTTANIAMIAQETVKDWVDYDSIDLTIAIGDWALEFEEAWEVLGLEDSDTADYIETVDYFTQKKLKEFKEENDYE